MRGLELWLKELVASETQLCNESSSVGGLFLEPAVPSSFVSFVPKKSRSASLSCLRETRRRRRRRRVGGGGFLSVSLAANGGGEGHFGESGEVLGENGEKGSFEDETVAFEGVGKVEVEKVVVGRGGGGGALNTTKHLWAGAIAAMVSRFAYI